MYVGTLNAHLVALDAVSGAVRWDVEVADNALGYAITSAPLAIDGKIIIGVSGGEAGIRGFLDAYDANTGKRVWRFYTVPGPGRAGSRDLGRRELEDRRRAHLAHRHVRSVAQPALLGRRQSRRRTGTATIAPGDNLYSCSLVALDAATGTLRWHFQFTPHDTHDWDANQIPVLVDATVDGRPRKLVVTANRNGFYYVLDRTTGEFLRGTPTRSRRGRSGLDARGRPSSFPAPNRPRRARSSGRACRAPPTGSAPPSTPRRQLLFVPVREMGSKYFKSEAVYEPGKPFMGGGETSAPGDQAYGAVRALDVVDRASDAGSTGCSRRCGPA